MLTKVNFKISRNSISMWDPVAPALQRRFHESEMLGQHRASLAGCTELTSVLRMLQHKSILCYSLTKIPSSSTHSCHHMSTSTKRSVECLITLCYCITADCYFTLVAHHLRGRRRSMLAPANPH